MFEICRGALKRWRHAGRASPRPWTGEAPVPTPNIILHTNPYSPYQPYSSHSDSCPADCLGSYGDHVEGAVGSGVAEAVGRVDEGRKGDIEPVDAKSGVD